MVDGLNEHNSKTENFRLSKIRFIPWQSDPLAPPLVAEKDILFEEPREFCMYSSFHSLSL